MRLWSISGAASVFSLKVALLCNCYVGRLWRFFFAFAVLTFAAALDAFLAMFYGAWLGSSAMMSVIRHQLTVMYRITI